MSRIGLMVLRNFWRAPGAYLKLCYYGNHTEKYAEEVKYAHIKYIFEMAVKSGNIDLKVYGKENIPKENGYLMYSNHQGLFDIVAIVVSCDNPWGAVLKKELCRHPLMRHIVDCSKSFPMDRGNMRQQMEVILSVIKEVKKGRNYLIFPEGTRSKKGNEMLQFHSGSFKCATKTKCPIVPIALLNTYKVFDQKGIKPVEVQVHYLKPIYYEEYKDLNTSELAKLVHDRIEDTVKKYS